ncbi:MAG: hypothetical protein HKN72_03495 [Gemmatimonadetes bacterium]|nr:hypothetical protein [Gemmatimonadota bacterium]
MDCAEARSALWPPERLRVVDARVTQARLHLDGCACCQEYFQQDEALLDVYSRVRELSAPMTLRRRIFDNLAAARWAPEEALGVEPWAGRVLQRSAWPLALVAVVGVVTVAQLGDTRRTIEPSAVFVEDYLRRAVGQEHIETDDPSEIRHFLERELGIALDPLAFAGFELARAEVCLLEGRLGAMIVYKGADGSLSHYLVPRDHADPRPPSVSTTANSSSMPVVTWATADLEQAVVGEIGAEALLALTTTSLR